MGLIKREGDHLLILDREGLNMRTGGLMVLALLSPRRTRDAIVVGVAIALAGSLVGDLVSPRLVLPFQLVCLWGVTAWIFRGWWRHWTFWRAIVAVTGVYLLLRWLL